MIAKLSAARTEKKLKLNYLRTTRQAPLFSNAARSIFVPRRLIKTKITLYFGKIAIFMAFKTRSHMTIRTTILLLAAATILASCGSQRKASRSAVTATTDPLYDIPEATSPGEAGYTEKKKDEKPKKSEENTAVFRPAMSFSYMESQHIRAAGIHQPLAAEGIVVDLDELKTEFTYPITRHKLSDYGQRGRSVHTGVDIKADANDTLRVVLDGVVRMSKYYSGYGNVVVVRHYNGLETVYAHNTRNLVDVNDVVCSGQPIALAGRTGQATGNHLHFEVRAAGDHFDPNLFIDCDNHCLRSGKLHLKPANGKLIVFNDPSAEATILAGLASQSGTADEKVEAAKVKSSSSSSSKAAYHTVKSGDTLSAIARRYSTTVDKLCKLNNIKKTSVLRIGQKIRYS